MLCGWQVRVLLPLWISVAMHGTFSLCSFVILIAWATYCFGRSTNTPTFYRKVIYVENFLRERHSAKHHLIKFYHDPGNQLSPEASLFFHPSKTKEFNLWPRQSSHRAVSRDYLTPSLVVRTLGQAVAGFAVLESHSWLWLPWSSVMNKA